MEIIDYYTSGCQGHWLEKMKKSDWGAGQYLYELLQKGELKELCGESTKVLLLVDGDELLSFCTYAEQDEIRETSLKPWVGFVYTFPEYRGNRLAGKLLEYAYAQAKREGYQHIYIHRRNRSVREVRIQFLENDERCNYRERIKSGSLYQLLCL